MRVPGRRKKDIAYIDKTLDALEKTITELPQITSSRNPNYIREHLDIIKKALRTIRAVEREIKKTRGITAEKFKIEMINQNKQSMIEAKFFLLERLKQIERERKR